MDKQSPADQGQPSDPSLDLLYAVLIRELPLLTHRRWKRLRSPMGEWQCASLSKVISAVPGMYAFFNQAHTLLYIGISKDLAKRMSTHNELKRGGVVEVAWREICLPEMEKEVAREIELIKRLKPRWNDPTSLARRAESFLAISGVVSRSLGRTSPSPQQRWTEKKNARFTTVTERIQTTPSIRYPGCSLWDELKLDGLIPEDAKLISDARTPRSAERDVS